MAKNSAFNKVGNSNQNYANKNKVNSKMNSKKYQSSSKDVKSYYHLIPLFMILCILPLIVRLKVYNCNLSQFAWFSTNDSQADVFLYDKHWTFVFIAAIMAIIVAVKVYIQRKSIKILPILIPLFVYALLCFLSAIFSKYAYFSFHGMFEMFESVYALLGYCLIVFYVILFVSSEHDFKMIIYFLIGISVVLSLMGVFQFLGYDFYASDIGYQFIIPSQYKGTELELTFGAKRVYLSLYNPNYVGVFVALIVPIITVVTLFQRKIFFIFISLLAIIGLLVCGIGSQSLSAFIGLITAIITICIFMWRYLLKRFYITLPIIFVLIISVTIFNNYTNQLLVNKFKDSLHIKKSQFSLSDIHTEKDGISLTYEGNTMKAQYQLDDNQNSTFLVSDSNNMPVAVNYDATTNTYVVSDTRFPDIILGFDPSNAGVFYLETIGKKWFFTNQTEDGTYDYINRFGKLDKINVAPSAVLTGYESFGSGRGYIWSRTFPLLKKYFFLGSGPDTFAIAFPQQDYFNLYRFGYDSQIVTKPHNMYLQMGVQTGMLSLIAFLIFYGMYFISSIILYLPGKFDNFFAQFGVAVFISTISFMVVGLTNDSNINTSPLFWVILGCGIAVNQKVKMLHQQ